MPINQLYRSAPLVKHHLIPCVGAIGGRQRWPVPVSQLGGVSWRTERWITRHMIMHQVRFVSIRERESAAQRGHPCRRNRAVGWWIVYAESSRFCFFALHLWNRERISLLNAWEEHSLLRWRRLLHICFAAESCKDRDHLLNSLPVELYAFMCSRDLRVTHALAVG